MKILKIVNQKALLQRKIYFEGKNWSMVKIGA